MHRPTDNAIDPAIDVERLVGLRVTRVVYPRDGAPPAIYFDDGTVLQIGDGVHVRGEYHKGPMLLIDGERAEPNA